MASPDTSASVTVAYGPNVPWFCRMPALVVCEETREAEVTFARAVLTGTRAQLAQASQFDYGIRYDALDAFATVLLATAVLIVYQQPVAALGGRTRDVTALKLALNDHVTTRRCARFADCVFTSDRMSVPYVQGFVVLPARLVLRPDGSPVREVDGNGRRHAVLPTLGCLTLIEARLGRPLFFLNDALEDTRGQLSPSKLPAATTVVPPDACCAVWVVGYGPGRTCCVGDIAPALLMQRVSMLATLMRRPALLRPCPRLPPRVCGDMDLVSSHDSKGVYHS